MDGRARTTNQAVDHLAQFEKAVELQKLPLKVGDWVLSHGNLCQLTSIVEDDPSSPAEDGASCVLQFTAGDVSQQHSYLCMYGNGDGNARLQHMPPTLTPSRRVISKNSVSEETRQLVKVHAYEICPESPCKRVEMRKHVGPRLWDIRQALILNFTKETMWSKFNDSHPGLLSATKYNEVLSEEVWHLKQAYKETCLCRTCFNCKLYREALWVVSQILALLLKPSSTADTHDTDADEDVCNNNLQRLYDFCVSHQSGRRRKTAELVCADTLQDSHSSCLSGQCARCGFAAVWQPVRKTLVYDSLAGKLRPEASRVYLTRIKWDRIRTGGDGSNSEDDLRQQREGTVIEFLDEAQVAYHNFIRTVSTLSNPRRQTASATPTSFQA
jgi:hypothetical protein